MRRLGLGLGLNGGNGNGAGAAVISDDRTGLTSEVYTDTDSALTLSGSNITAFKDQSGNAYDYTHTAEGTVWTRSTSVLLNAKNTAVPGGDYTRYLTAVGVTVASLFGATGETGTIVAVARCDDVSATRYLFTQASPAYIRIETAAGPNIVFRFNNSGSGNVTVSRSITTTKFHLIIARWNGTNFYLSVDGGAEDSAAGTTPVATTSRVSIGGDGGTAGFWRNGLAHLRTYNVCKTPTQVANLVSYFNSRYGTFPVTP